MLLNFNWFDVYHSIFWIICDQMLLMCSGLFLTNRFLEYTSVFNKCIFLIVTWSMLLTIFNLFLSKSVHCAFKTCFFIVFFNCYLIYAFNYFQSISFKICSLCFQAPFFIVKSIISKKVLEFFYQLFLNKFLIVFVQPIFLIAFCSTYISYSFCST